MRPDQPHGAGATQLEVPLKVRRGRGEEYPRGDLAEIERRVTELARRRRKRLEPASIAEEIALAIGRARAGGREKVLGRNVRGLSRLRPSTAGRIYLSLLDEDSKRDLGAFYTPAPLARRLVRLAFAGKASPSVIDPSCGCGAFLLEAAFILERKLGCAREASRRLYGIDRDEGALRVCRAVLAAHGFDPPEQNLEVADALQERWPKPPEGAFHAVVGNPPYRNIVRLPPATRSALKKRYATFRNKCDLYALFVEAAARHLLPGGRLALLVSDSFLGTSSFAPLRRLLFGGEAMHTRLVEHVYGSPFPEAAVKVVALVSERAGELDPYEIRSRDRSSPQLSLVGGEGRRSRPGLPCADAPVRPAGLGTVRFSRITAGGRLLSTVRVSREELKVQCETSAAIPVDPRALTLAKTMRSAGVPLGELAEVVLGIKTGDDSRFIVEGDRPPGESYVRCVRGREVAPWQSSGPGAWLRYDPEEMRAVHGARPRRRESFERPEKLLVRETSGTRLIAAFDDKGRFPLDTLHCVLVKEGSAASLWYLLAILNSGPASFYYGLHHPGPHVKASELRALPVPPPAPCSQRERELSLQMIEWIEMCELDCSDGVSAESTAARERLKRHGEETRDDVALRTALLEELARLLTRSTEPEVRDRGSAVLDEVVAAAYGMAGDES